MTVQTGATVAQDPAGEAPDDSSTTVPASTTTTSSSSTTVTTASPTSSTTTTTPPVSSTTIPNTTDGAPKPPTGAGPTLPEVHTDGSGREDAGGEVALDPNAFLLDLDGRSLSALALSPAAQQQHQAALSALRTAEAQVAGALSEVERLTDALGQAGRRERRAANAIETTTAELARRAVAGYVAGPEARPASWLGAERDDLAIQEVFLSALADADQGAIDRWRVAQRDASGEANRLGRELRSARASLAAARAELATATEVEAAARLRVSILTGSEDAVAFTFPVSGGTYSYSNDWGFPRSGGRRHEGTDIFGPRGTPLVAVEAGTITRVGVGKLGGNVVWLRGDSGHRYYYAHLDAFWPGVTVGSRLLPGEPLGRLGDTGNAKGTPPHLHFEIHPDGLGGPVNPYPVLRLVSEAEGAKLRDGGSSVVTGPGHAKATNPAPWEDYAQPAPTPAPEPGSGGATPPAAVTPTPALRRQGGRQP